MEIYSKLNKILFPAISWSDGDARFVGIGFDANRIMGSTVYGEHGIWGARYMGSTVYGEHGIWGARYMGSTVYGEHGIVDV